MQELMLNAGLSEPLYETEGMFNIILLRKGHSANSPKLTDLEKQVIELMSGDVKPTVDELCKKINRKKSTTYNLLKSLRDKGLLN